MWEDGPQTEYDWFDAEKYGISNGTEIGGTGGYRYYATTDVCIGGGCGSASCSDTEMVWTSMQIV